MALSRLSKRELADFLVSCPADLCDRVLELREWVLKTAREASETIAFHALCYYKAGVPYGVIGGNVCGIGWRDGCVIVSFVHGASLPDPAGRLIGNGKAMRRLRYSPDEPLDRAYLKKLLRAAVAHDPTRP